MMNILILTPDVPYPAFKGQRADVWRRIQCFIKLGISVSIIYFYDILNTKQHKEFQRVCTGIGVQAYGMPIKRSLLKDTYRVIKSFIYKVPYHALVRSPTKSDLSAINKLLLTSTPELFWLEGLWIYETFNSLIKELNLKSTFYYRSHNIEYKYMHSQLSIDNSFIGNIKKFIQTSLIKKYEISVINSASIVFDISYDDALYWKNQGFKNIEVLPPLPESSLLELSDLSYKRNQTKIYDVMFLGNLRTPNNVQGVFFLINEVLPKLKEKKQDIRLVIAGSNPSNSIIDLCFSNPNVELFVDVEDAFGLICQAKVLVNPVATGSGVMVKMLDLLMTDQPIITMPQGVCGLPKVVLETVTIAESPSDFADAILNYLSSLNLVDIPLRNKARLEFSLEKIQEIIKNYFRR